jgi:hypothetical protein
MFVISIAALKRNTAILRAVTEATAHQGRDGFAQDLWP